MKGLERIKRLAATAHRGLRKAIGEENDILFHFVRLVLALMLLAPLILAAFEVEVGLTKFIPIIAGAVMAALPLLMVIAIAACFLPIYVLNVRTERLRRQRAAEEQADRQRIGEERLRARAARIQQSLLDVDQQTRQGLENVLSSLRRFDHRLEVAITPDHYTNVFGDNWVNVREFVGSVNGKNVPDVSAMLVEVIVLYKRAQSVPWIHENLYLRRSWWSEASEKRTWLSNVVQAAQIPDVAGKALTEAHFSDGAPAVQELLVVPPPLPLMTKAATREMTVEPPPAAKVKKAPIPELNVKAPPPAPVIAGGGPRTLGPAPILSVPPSLDELQRYYEWISHSS